MNATRSKLPQIAFVVMFFVGLLVPKPALAIAPDAINELVNGSADYDCDLYTNRIARFLCNAAVWLGENPEDYLKPPSAEPEPVVEPTEVPAADLGDCDVVVVSDYTSKYKNNTDDGHGTLITIWLAGQGFTETDEWIMNVLPPMANLDLEADEILSYAWKVEGTMEAAECAAEAILKDMGVEAYRFTPTAGTLSADWRQELPDEWEGEVVVFTEKPIEPGGKWSKDLPLTYGEHELCAPENGFANGQLWNPNMEDPDGDPKTPLPAVHPAIQGGYCLTVTLAQGTWWTVIDDSTLDYDKLIERWLQTQREVDLRDDHPEITALWCGVDADMPVGFTTELPDGYSCTK